MMQTLKGGFFVIATGVMIFFLIETRLKILKTREHCYRTLFESAGDGVFIFDKTGIIDCNKQTLNLFKYADRKDLTGKKPWELSPPFQPDGRSSEEAAAERIELALKGIPQFFNWQHLNSEGSIIDGSISISLADAEAGILVAIFHDMTEFNYLQEQLQQSLKMKAVGQLAGGVAHDFNNILSAVLGYAELASDEVKGKQPVSGYIENIIKAGSRAGQLVSRILTFSRQSNELKLPVSLTPIVNEVVELLRASLPSTTELKLQVVKDTSPVIADPGRVHEVLMNLASNAVSAMDEKGTVEVILREEKTASEIPGIIGPIAPGFYSVIEVRDTGEGMDESIISRIFEPFYTTKSDKKGTGLGLSVVYGVMQSHKGNIQLESIIGKGTVFRLYFPKTKEKTVSENIIKKSSPEGKERILFVDDEEVLAELGKSMLSALGYVVETATDSTEAYKLLLDSIQDYDLLITDQTMPNLTGIELAEKVLKIDPQFPVILCTGFSTKVNERKAKTAGCRGFAYKPLTRQLLADLIRTVLDT